MCIRERECISSQPVVFLCTHQHLKVEHDLEGLVTDKSVYLAYLPLAHIMEMCAEIAMFTLGAAVGFGTPQTLTDSGVKLKRPESIGDAPCLKPSFMVFAPAVLDKIYMAVMGRKDSFGLVPKTIFEWGLVSGERRHLQHQKVGANVFYNEAIFKKIQKLVGGKLKGIISGSAPLSPEIQKLHGGVSICCCHHTVLWRRPRQEDTFYDAVRIRSDEPTGDDCHTSAPFAMNTLGMQEHVRLLQKQSHRSVEV